jgi:hypothetical protein
MNVLQDDARSLGRFRSVRKRTKWGIPSEKIFHTENGDHGKEYYEPIDHDTSKEEYDF